MSPCPLCPRSNKPVPPCGPPNANVLFCGEEPGSQEQEKGIPFIGPTGRELTEQYLPLAGLDRSQVRITNAVCCLIGKGKLKPGDKIIESCARAHLYQEIKRCRPQLIVPMGGVVASLIPNLHLDTHWGFPLLWDVPGAGEHTIFPMFHPALGLHKIKEMTRLRTGFKRLRKYLRGELRLPVDQYPNPDYAEAGTVTDLDLYFQQVTASSPQQNGPVVNTGLKMAIDTETTRDGDPFCLTFSIQPGTARLIRASNTLVLKCFNNWIQLWRGIILLHNRLFDRPVLARMGVSVPRRLIIDTMAEAYHLGNLPQGLKALVWRLLGADMQDFDDLVTPHSLAKALLYLAEAFSIDWPKPDEEMVRDKSGNWKLYKPQRFGTKLKRMFTDLGNIPALDVFERWGKWESDHEQVENKLGRWPGKCISHVPFGQIITYACSDAARTLELWHILQKASRLVRRLPESEWYQ